MMLLLWLFRPVFSTCAVWLPAMRRNVHGSLFDECHVNIAFAAARPCFVYIGHDTLLMITTQFKQKIVLLFTAFSSCSPFFFHKGK